MTTPEPDTYEVELAKQGLRYQMKTYGLTAQEVVDKWQQMKVV